MNEQTTATRAVKPIFRALLVPYRSLGSFGFAVVMSVLLVALAMSGAVFLARGAWPVFAFLGVAVLAVFAAFRLNYRAGRSREEITLSREWLEIRQIAPSGEERRHRFNPFWTHFDVSRHDEIGITAMAVSCRGTIVPIGGFLNPDDRESFAAAFGRALAAARR